MRVTMGSQRVSCGRDFTYSQDINRTLDETCKCGFDFACVPLVNPRYKREFHDEPAKHRPGAVTRSDLLLTSQDWGSLIVAKISPWLQIDSPHEMVRKNSEKAFQQELRFASHLSVPALLIPVKGANCVNLARILNEHILSGYNHQYWLRIPMTAPRDQCDDVIGDADPNKEMNCEESDTWYWWNTVRTICDSTRKLGIALEVSADLPSPEVLERWRGEPIKAAILSTNIFMTNKKGYPVLSRAHQLLVREMFRLDVQMIISGCDRHPDKGIRTYQQYLDHLWQTQEPLDTVSSFSKGYEDYLQSPLQPLMDNLESQTYEVFEKDPIKYSQYQRAVYLAVLDRIPEEEKGTKVLTLMVLGAGRGPLVTASINAAHAADRKIQVYAVEKNPNAVVTLENLKDEMWGEQVTVVASDMRHWNPPTKADIIVSELLGSFGDNELSPECLDGAQKFLKDDGISIPCQYTSYLAPLSSNRLWNEVRACKEPYKQPDAPFETPYVVRIHNCQTLAEPKRVFRFEHPNRAKQIDNSRYIVLDFTVPIDTVLHGFVGYFDTVLYKDVTLSIVPQTHSPGMFSWFPIYFPIKEPMFLNAGCQLQLHFWRLCTEKNVWYEWCVTSPYPRPVHNPKGRSYTIGL